MKHQRLCSALSIIPFNFLTYFFMKADFVTGLRKKRIPCNESVKAPGCLYVVITYTYMFWYNQRTSLHIHIIYRYTYVYFFFRLLARDSPFSGEALSAVSVATPVARRPRRRSTSPRIPGATTRSAVGSNLPLSGLYAGCVMRN